MYNYSSNDAIKVTLPKKATECRTWYDKKEMISAYIGIVIKDNKPCDTVTVKFFMGRSSNSSTVYCNFWIDNKDENGNFIYCNGAGKAGGYGYDKTSSAFQYALNNAGIVASENIAGVGSTAIKRMIEGIIESQGYSNYIIKQV
jgi:hypothetical protein